MNTPSSYEVTPESVVVKTGRPVSPVRVDAFATVAWEDAVTPDRSLSGHAHLGIKHTLKTYDDVRDKLGKEAADAWQAAVDAKAAYDAAVRRAVRKAEQEVEDFERAAEIAKAAIDHMQAQGKS